MTDLQERRGPADAHVVAVDVAPPPRTERPVSNGRRFRRHHAVLGAIVLLGAALRAFHLGYQSMVSDEGYTFALAQRPFGDMLDLLVFEANGALYSLLAWPLVHVSEALSLVRLPAAVAGILAVPAMYWAGSELIGRRTALIGAFLLAISPAAVYYSQIARAYVLVVLFSSLSYGALASALRTGSRWWWVCYALALAAVGYSNALAIGLLVIAQAVMVLPRGRPRVVRWIAAGALTAVVIVPLALLLHAETERRDALYYLDRPGMRSIRYWLGDLVAGHADRQTAAAYAILLVTVCILAYTLWRGRAALRPVRSLAHHRLTPIVAWAFAPPLVAFLISQIHPVFAPPYVICALPGTVLLVAACLERAPKTVGVAGLLTIVVLGGVCLSWQTTNTTTADYRRAARWLDERRNPTDPILIDDIGGLGALGYYAHSLRTPNGWLAVQEWHDTPLPTGRNRSQRPRRLQRRTTRPPNAQARRRARAEDGQDVRGRQRHLPPRRPAQRRRQRHRVGPTPLHSHPAAVREARRPRDFELS